MNKAQFFIDDYYVDLSRNQITKDKKISRYPPKVMAVLSMLVEHQGQVVSFDELMASVWSDRVVTINTLQRCIFQIRQAFKDDSKSPRIIKTHAKQGYSLEAHITLAPCDVITSTNKSVNAEESIENNDLRRRGILLIALLTTLLIAAFSTTFNLQNSQEIHFSKANIITSSDDWESNGSYSADGRFILFQRHINNCYSNLWTKDLVSQKEYQLTDVAGIYGKPNWSPDGNQITFVERKGCPHEDNSLDYCWSVKSLTVIDGITTPQTPVNRLACGKNPIWQAKWLPHGQIAFIHANNEKSSLQLYNPKTDVIHDIYQAENSYIYEYDVDLKKEKLAILSISKTNTHQLDIVDLQGNIKSSKPIILPDGISALNYLSVQYHPSGEHLITSTSNGLYQLFENGEMQKINMAERHGLYNPSYSSLNQRVVATEVIADTDNIMLNLTDIDSKKEPIKLSKFHFSRSNQSEDNPKFQPNGELISFTSKRTGKRQLWTYDGDHQFQISRLDGGIQSKDIAWSPSGKRIATIAKDSLYIFSLNGQFDIVSTKLPIHNIMQWYSVNELLVLAREDGDEQLYLFNLKSAQFTKLNAKNAVWANITDNRQLVFLDTSQRFWLQGTQGEELKELKALYNQLEQNRVAMTAHSLMGINKKMQLWTYSLTFDAFEIIAQLPKSARYVSDVNNEKLLMTHMNALKKDLIELY